jgi:CheY-like chemotaxis protein
MILAVIADLFFSERVRETARAAGRQVEIVRDPSAAIARAPLATLIVVDMNLKAGDAAALVRALKADERTRAIPVVGYLFDAHEDLIRAAREAGCDKVLSRGGLTKKLPELLQAAAASTPSRP